MVSAPPPPLQAGTFSRGVVTMRCDVSTCSSAHISLLLSGSAQTCFDDQVIPKSFMWNGFFVGSYLYLPILLLICFQLLENHIKNEIIENSQLVRSLPSSEGNKLPLSEPRKSSSIACGATVFEVSMKVPAWASQVFNPLFLSLLFLTIFFFF